MNGSGAGARWVLAWLLAALLIVLTPLAIAGGWMRAVLLDTDRYVATVAPLVDDPAVQAALSDQISAQVIGAIDVRDILGLDGGPLEGLVDDGLQRLQDLLREQVDRVVASDVFARAWVSANRDGHDLVVAALTGQSAAVQIDETDVNVQGEAFVRAVKEGLTEEGLGGVADLVPEIDATFVVFSSDALPTVQRGVRLLDAVGAWSWVVALGVAVAVVLVAPRRSTGLGLVAGAVALGALLLAGGRALLRGLYLADPDAVLSVDVRAAVLDQVTSLLWSATLAALVAAGLLAALAWLLSRLSGTPAPSGVDQSP